jgi:hypothetical protein
MENYKIKDRIQNKKKEYPLNHHKLLLLLSRQPACLNCHKRIVYKIIGLKSLEENIPQARDRPWHEVCMWVPFSSKIYHLAVISIFISIKKFKKSASYLDYFS